jgi:predicted dinucleotide-binding enzyme
MKIGIIGAGNIGAAGTLLFIQILTGREARAALKNPQKARTA